MTKIPKTEIQDSKLFQYWKLILRYIWTKNTLCDWHAVNN